MADIIPSGVDKTTGQQARYSNTNDKLTPPDGQELVIGTSDGTGIVASTSIVGGESSDNAGGPISIDGGSGDLLGGSVDIGGGFSANGLGGSVTLIGGDGEGGDGGDIDLQGGFADQDGGGISLAGGEGNSNGGGITIVGGEDTGGSGAGGSITMTAGSSDATGGSITMTAGSSSGTPGDINIVSGPGISSADDGVINFRAGSQDLIEFSFNEDDLISGENIIRVRGADNLEYFVIEAPRGNGLEDGKNLLLLGGSHTTAEGFDGGSVMLAGGEPDMGNTTGSIQIGSSAVNTVLGRSPGAVVIGDESDTSQSVEIFNFSSGQTTITNNSFETGNDDNGLILVDRGGTKILNTGGTLEFGPVYYDPNTGQKIRFGPQSITIDGDGTVNTIRGDDADEDSDEVLTKIGATDATADLAVIGPISETPLTPGTVTIRVFLAASPTTVSTVTDDGLGAFPVSAVLPAGGTVTYATGALTGTTASLVATSEVVALYQIDDESGQPLTPRGGNGVGAGDGGNLDLQGGEGGATGNGGDVLITSGAGGSTSGNSGDVDISAGSVTSGTPGVVMVNSLPLPTVLSSTTSIDLTATGDTSLYTVPTGRSAKIISVVITPTSASAANGDAIVSIGTNASTYDDIIAAQTLTGLDATTESFTLNVAGISHTAAAAEIVTFQVDSADTGTTLTATVELIGYLR